MRFLIQTECIIGARLVQPLEGDSHGLARALAGMRLRLHCCTEPRGAVGRRQLPRQPAPRARARAWGGLRVAQAVRDAQGAVNRRHFEGGAGLGESLRARRGARLEPEQLRVGTLWTSWGWGGGGGLQGLSGTPTSMCEHLIRVSGSFALYKGVIHLFLLWRKVTDHETHVGCSQVCWQTAESLCQLSL